MTRIGRTRAGTWIAFAAACLVRYRWPRTVRTVSVVIAASLGMAHGAADDSLVAARFPGRRFARPLVAGTYAATAASTFALAWMSPKVATPLLTALTWYHFGTGDAAFAEACGGERASSASWLVRGAIPIAGLPLRLIAASAAFVRAVRAARSQRFGDCIDLALPALAFAFAPGRETFLAYFALWHAPRHLALIVECYGEGRSARERARRFVAAALPNALAALLVGLPVFALGPLARARAARAFILGITVPHLVAVAWLESARSIDSRAHERLIEQRSEADRTVPSAFSS